MVLVHCFQLCQFLSRRTFAHSRSRALRFGKYLHVGQINPLNSHYKFNPSLCREYRILFCFFLRILRCGIVTCLNKSSGECLMFDWYPNTALWKRSPKKVSIQADSMRMRKLLKCLTIHVASTTTSDSREYSIGKSHASSKDQHVIIFSDRQ